MNKMEADDVHSVMALPLTADDGKDPLDTRPSAQHLLTMVIPPTPEKGDIVENPGIHDVLLGRGGGNNNYCGNIKFRRLVNEHKMRYLACTKMQKPKVAKEVVGLWRKLNPPGRFLKKKDKTKSSVWVEVGDKKAREKTSQCLRERTPEVLRKMEEEKENAINNAKMAKVKKEPGSVGDNSQKAKEETASVKPEKPEACNKTDNNNVVDMRTDDCDDDCDDTISEASYVMAAVVSPVRSPEKVVTTKLTKAPGIPLKNTPKKDPAPKKVVTKDQKKPTPSRSNGAKRVAKAEEDKATPQPVKRARLAKSDSSRSSRPSKGGMAGPRRISLPMASDYAVNGGASDPFSGGVGGSMSYIGNPYLDSHLQGGPQNSAQARIRQKRMHLQQLIRKQQRMQQQLEQQIQMEQALLEQELRMAGATEEARGGEGPGSTLEKQQEDVPRSVEFPSDSSSHDQDNLDTADPYTEMTLYRKTLGDIVEDESNHCHFEDAPEDLSVGALRTEWKGYAHETEEPRNVSPRPDPPAKAATLNKREPCRGVQRQHSGQSLQSLKSLSGISVQSALSVPVSIVVDESESGTDEEIEKHYSFHESGLSEISP